MSHKNPGSAPRKMLNAGFTQERGRRRSPNRRSTGDILINYEKAVRSGKRAAFQTWIRWCSMTETMESGWIFTRSTQNLRCENVIKPSNKSSVPTPFRQKQMLHNTDGQRNPSSPDSKSQRGFDEVSCPSWALFCLLLCVLVYATCQR